MKYHLQKRSKNWWIVSVDKDNNREGIDGSKTKKDAVSWAKIWGLKLEKEDLPKID